MVRMVPSNADLWFWQLGTITISDPQNISGPKVCAVPLYRDGLSNKENKINSMASEKLLFRAKPTTKSNKLTHTFSA